MKLGKHFKHHIELGKLFANRPLKYQSQGLLGILSFSNVIIGGVGQCKAWHVRVLYFLQKVTETWRTGIAIDLDGSCTLSHLELKLTNH